jgi:hypothetical protein
MKGIVIAVAALLVIPAAAFSQTSNAALGGTVADGSGALIAGVTLTATNTQTGIAASISSNETGTYQFASLQPGIYRLAATAAGFRTHVYNTITLGLSQQVRLNLALEAGLLSEIVEVNVATQTGMATSSSSVGAALFEYSLRDLPSAGGNVLDLVLMTPGTQGSSFAGGRSSQVNTTRDGISVNDGRYDNGVYSQTYMSTDLVDEMRIAIAPADAEMGRGSGQVRLATRSGTNEFRGSLFWVNRNSVLDASSWFNNFNGLNKDYLNRNQFGGRLGGPIVRNKTFFFVLFEGMRTVQKTMAIADTLTAQARQGIFRHFPGVRNGNALSANPSVDILGNPLTPRGATGPLTSFNLFGRNVNGVVTPWDPLRPGFDPTGHIQRILASMPLPNDFTAHDGLNWAHYRWIRRTQGSEDTNGLGIDINRNELNLRIDHQFNQNNRLSLSGSRDHTWADNAALSNFPGGFNGQIVRHPKVYTASLVSNLSQNIVNEFRFGLRRGRVEDYQAYDVPGKRGEEARKLLGVNNGIPYIVRANFLILQYGINDTGGSRGNTVPLYTYADTLSWTRGRHAFKSGVELRFGANNAWTSQNIIPRVQLGPFQGGGPNIIPGIPVQGINATNMPGLDGADQGTARTLLVDLAGSVGQINQAFSMAPDPKNIVFQDYRELDRRYRDIRQNEWSAFFKDDWKIHPNLTLNLGVRYEYYGVPYESHGITAAPIGGGLAIVHGSDSITSEFVGKKSPQPDKQLFKDDWNNIGPAIGFSWSMPFLGKDKTVLRAGYGISYQGGGQGAIYDTAIGSFPGTNQFASHREGTTYVNLSNISLPIPERFPSGSLPVVPLTARNDTIYAWDPNRVAPYIQNANVEIQRALGADLTLSVRYIGTKGTKLFGGIPQNYTNVLPNGLLDAFNITRGGGHAPLFDQMLRGLVINAGQGAVNGATVTGSAALRENTATEVNLANGNINSFANYLNTTANFSNSVGGLLRNGGLPENFIVKNPQFLNAHLYSNPGSSSYHSMQVAFSQGLSHGFSNETTYVWSRAIGNADGDGVKAYLDHQNRSLDKSLLAIHRTHYLTSNGTFELPFGPGRPLLSNAPAFIARLVERWQLGAIFSLSSGQPLTITAGSTASGAANVPDVVGDFPKNAGKVTRVANGITYFEGLRQAPDPAKTAVTSAQGLSDSFSNLALADSQGRIILQHAAPGKIGTLGRNWFEGPGRMGLDLNLLKRVRLRENKSLELRLDAVNALNRPQFANPVIVLNNNNVGRILAASGNRQFTFNVRLNF